MHPNPARSVLALAALTLGSSASAATGDPQRATTAQTGQFPPSQGYSRDLTLLAKNAEAATRTAFFKLIERPRVDLAPDVKELGVVEGLKQAHFSYVTEAGQRVPGLWYQAANATGRLPVVVVLHGTGGSKDSVKDLLVTYARAGFAAIAIDGRYHGERIGAAKNGNEAYQAAILRAWQKPGNEHPFFFDTAWDIIRLVDWLETRPDVDAKRIGLIGISKGGIEAYLAAAVDQRIAVAVPCIAVQSFKWALDHDAWQSRIGTIQNAVNAAAKEAGVTTIDAAFIRKFYARVAPEIDGQFDGPSMLSLIAPRPALVINGDTDARTPLAGVQECIARARQSYSAKNAADRLQFVAQKDTGHKVTPEAHALALDWFKVWLKPTPVAAP